MRSVSDSRKRITQRDVAKAAGVSLKTVTQAINRETGHRVKDATRDRILEIADKLGYRPNFGGRALVSGKTHTIGVLQNSLERVRFFMYQDILYGIVGAMRPLGYHPLLLFFDDPEGYTRVLEEGRVDGLFLIQSDFDDSHIRRALATGVPLVVVNKRHQPAPGERAACVHSDHVGVARTVVADFVARGCRCLLFIHEYRTHDANYTVQETFNAELARLAGTGIVGATWTPSQEVIQAQMRDLVRTPALFDGVFVDGTNDAEAFVDAADEAGLRPGRDYHLACTDTRTEVLTRQRAEFAMHGQQTQEMGRRAWGLMRDLLDGGEGGRVEAVPYLRIDNEPQPSAGVAPTQIHVGARTVVESRKLES